MSSHEDLGFHERFPSLDPATGQILEQLQSMPGIYAGKHIAIVNGEIVGYDEDNAALIMRVETLYPHQNKLYTRVPEAQENDARKQYIPPHIVETLPLNKLEELVED